jgi:hypothetical protein
LLTADTETFQFALDERDVVRSLFPSDGVGGNQISGKAG